MSCDLTELSCDLISCLDPTPPLNVSLSLDTPSAMYNSTSNSFTINASVSWDPPSQSNGVLANYTVTIICVDGYREIISITVDSSTNTLTVSVVVKPYRLYFVVVTVANGVGSASANSSAVFSPQAGIDRIRVLLKAHYNFTKYM